MECTNYSPANDKKGDVTPMSFRLVIFRLKFQQTAEYRANFDLSRDKFIHMTESERSVSNFGELGTV